MSKVGIFGAGWVGLVTGACFAELGHEVVIRDVVAAKIDALQRGRGARSTRPSSPSCSHANAERITYTLEAEDIAGCEFLFVCVDTPPTYSGDADLSRVWTVVDELPELDGASDSRHEVDRPGRHRREGARRARPARPRARRLRLEPRVPRRGPRDRRLHGPRPDRGRRVRRRATRTRSRSSTTRSTRRSCART